MTTSVNRAYMPEIDHLRAAAALLVMFYHGLQVIGTLLVHQAAFNPDKHWLRPDNPLLAIVQEGHTGVGLFIVLSGFILSFGAIGHTVEYKPFLIARILRIYPMLVLCAAVAIYTTRANILTVFTLLLPLQLSSSVGSPFTNMFWAVAIEFQCYLLFPFLIAFSNGRGTRFLVQVVAVCVVTGALAIFGAGAAARDIAYWTILGRLGQFCIGIIAARLYLRHNWSAFSGWWFLPSVLIAGATIWMFNRLGGFPMASNWWLLWPVVEALVWAAVIVTYTAAGRHLPYAISWLWAKLGEISYSMYLLHFPVVVAVGYQGWVLRWTGDGYSDAILTTALVVLPTVIAISVLTYRTVELPFLEMRPKYIRRSEHAQREATDC